MRFEFRVKPRAIEPVRVSHRVNAKIDLWIERECPNLINHRIDIRTYELRIIQICNHTRPESDSVSAFDVSKPLIT